MKTMLIRLATDDVCKFVVSGGNALMNTW